MATDRCKERGRLGRLRDEGRDGERDEGRGWVYQGGYILSIEGGIEGESQSANLQQPGDERREVGEVGE